MFQVVTVTRSRPSPGLVTFRSEQERKAGICVKQDGERKGKEGVAKACVKMAWLELDGHILQAMFLLSSPPPSSSR